MERPIHSAREGKHPVGLASRDWVHSVSSKPARVASKAAHRRSLRKDRPRVWSRTRHTGPQASMCSELQFSWLLKQPAGLCSACKAFVWSPPGAGGRCLWTLATCRGASEDLGLTLPSCCFVFWGSSDLPTSINIHAPLQSQGASSQNKLNLVTSLAVEAGGCDHPGCIPCKWPVT